jgi:hypothetical protein
LGSDIPFVTSRNIENDTMCHFGTCPDGRIGALAARIWPHVVDFDHWAAAGVSALGNQPCKGCFPAIDWLNAEG